MTKDEQTIANLKKLKSVHNGSYGADIDRAIKVLEQEPILGKIRAEINKLPDLNPDYEMDKTIHVSKWAVFDIIDKYKAEREGER